MTPEAELPGFLLQGRGHRRGSGRSARPAHPKRKKHGKNSIIQLYILERVIEREGERVIHRYFFLVGGTQLNLPFLSISRVGI